MFVNVCVFCCKEAVQGDKTLPVFCEKIKMPCFALKPEFLIPTPSKEFLNFLEVNNTDRIPLDSKFIDTDFVKSRLQVQISEADDRIMRH